MTWAIRSCALAAGAAALLSAQAAYAAPALNRSTSVDPLVSLSVLGTAQSRAAVCGATAGDRLHAKGHVSCLGQLDRSARTLDWPGPWRHCW